MGVNLPAHLVVLKGTRRWCSDTSETAGYKEYDRSTCLQMIGRAGRPQFDTEGVAVIMTQKQVRDHLRTLLPCYVQTPAVTSTLQLLSPLVAI